MKIRDQIQVHPFGTLPTGETVEEYTLTNLHGLTLKLITYGGIITELQAPDRKGVPADVVLGFRDLAGYLEQSAYIGAIIGRVAGRISGGSFALDGTRYQLAVNNPPNHLHGGVVGFDQRIWHAQAWVNEDDNAAVKLSYHSPEGEEGYPGNVDVSVIVSLTDANEVVLRYEAVTDRATPLSLTSHCYFNLAGEGTGTMENHVLQIHSPEFVPSDKEMTLLGRRMPVAGTANDFQRATRIGDALPGLAGQHGENYLIPHRAHKSLELVARATEPSSGRVMEVWTTEDSLQFYTGAYLVSSKAGKAGRNYPPLAGFCLECQGYPDGVNHPELEDIILRPGDIYRQTTIYRFSTE
jgi:aldose 1-epimerase